MPFSVGHLIMLECHGPNGGRNASFLQGAPFCQVLLGWAGQVKIRFSFRMGPSKYRCESSAIRKQVTYTIAARKHSVPNFPKLATREGGYFPKSRFQMSKTRKWIM